ncbi:MAG: alpha/beta hydrolase fold domain-containing protein [Acidimicrobiia bacterium]
MAQILLFVSILGLLGALNALRPPHTERPPQRRPPWLPAMLTTELIPLRIGVRTVLVAITAWVGALDQRAGHIALGVTAATWVLYLVLLWRSGSAGKEMRRALEAAGFDAPSHHGSFDWVAMATGNPYLLPRRLRRTADIEYAPGLGLDIYRHRDHDAEGSPTLVQIHGGGWHGGNRRQQGRPLLHHMARRGWVGVSVSYPLVPAATFPEMLVALKAALAWLRTDGATYGVDPDRIFVTGGSAGAHLAALTALTAGRHEYQPGFEEADTTVQGAVTLYGTYDFLNRNETRDPWAVIPRGVMKSSPAEDEARYREASPLDQVHAGAPPFLVIHGSHDSLVSSEESRQFAAALRRASAAPVAYAEIPGATHAFDIVPSLRTQLTMRGISTFLEALARPRSEGIGAPEPHPDAVTPARGRRRDAPRAGSPRRSFWRRGRPSA